MSETFRIVCPNCGQGFRAMVAHVGLSAKCAKCGQSIVIAPPGEAPPMASGAEVAGTNDPVGSAPSESVGAFASESGDPLTSGAAGAASDWDAFAEATDGGVSEEVFGDGGLSGSEAIGSTPSPSIPPVPVRTRSGGMVWIAIGVLSLVVVGIGGAGGYYFYSSSWEAPPAPTPVVATTETPTPQPKRGRPVRPVRKLPAKTARPSIDLEANGLVNVGLSTTVDDLTSDPKGRLEVGGGGTWEDGSLKLKEGGSVAKSVESGATFELAVWFDMPRLKSSDGEWMVRCVLETDGGNAIVVELQRPLSGTRRFGRVSIQGRRSGDDAAAMGGSLNDELEDLATGWWVIRCHHGLVTVLTSQEETVHGYVPLLAEGVRGFRIENPGVQVGIREIQYGTSPAQRRGSEDYQAYADAVRERGEWRRLIREGDLEGARTRIEKSKEVFQRLGGEEDPGYLACLGGEAALADLSGELEKADSLHKDYVSKTLSLLGAAHPWSACAEFDLGVSHWRRGEPKESETHMDAGLDRLRRIGVRDTGLADMLSLATECAASLGDTIRTVSLRRAEVESLRELYGEADPRYHRALEQLSIELLMAGGGEEGRNVHKRVQDLVRAHPGEKNSNLIEGLKATIAFMFSRGGADPDKAVEACDEAMRLLESEGRKDDPDYSRIAYYRLAISDYLPEGRKMDEDAFRALATSIESLLSAKETLTKEECETLSGVAFLSSFVSRPEKAFPIAKRALEQFRKLPHYANEREYSQSLRNLCVLALAAKTTEEIRPLVLEGIETERTKAIRASRVVRDPQRGTSPLAAYGSLVDAAWPVLGEDEAAHRSMYELLMVRKAMGNERRRRMRVYRSDPNLVARFEELNRLAERVEFLQSQMRSDAPIRLAPILDELTQRHGALESELEKQSPAFARLQKPTTIEEAMAPLDESVLFVDFYDHLGTNKEKQVSYRASAFVIRKGQPIRLVELGELEKVEKHAMEWRSRRYGAKESKEEDHAAALKKLLWKPISGEMDGVRTVLISPDGSLAGFPWPALPGDAKGSYLIEQYGFAVVPSIVRMAKNATELDAVGEASLLFVSNPDLKGKAGFTAVTDEPFGYTPDRFPMRAEEEILPLANSQEELKEVRGVFDGKFAGKAVKVLEGADAVESTIREELGKHRFVHLSARTKLERQRARPSFALGVSFAGSRIPVDYYADTPRGAIGFGGVNSVAGFSTDPKQVADDGFLTSNEIAGLDLSGTELIVLSASDAGLGITPEGEGLLGLQKSFHDAGVRSTLTGLWRTDESAMQAVVAEFYRNYWEKGMSRVESLREAQLRVLREYDPKKGRMRPAESDEEDEEESEESSEEESKEKAPRLSPYHWAGFELSGDWR